MILEEAIKVIVANWEDLYKKNKIGNYGTPTTPAVWVAISDKSEPYEVDREWIGISPQGNIVWAYASGCSCWDGDYNEITKPTIKEFTLNHGHTPEQWEKAIIKFAETKVIQEL